MARAAGVKQQWLTPKAALELLSARFPDPEDGKEALVQYAASGLIRSRCERAIIRQGPFGTETLVEERHVNTEFWTAFSAAEQRGTENWTIAVFAASGVQNPKMVFDTYFARLLGVEFHEADIVTQFHVPQWAAPHVVPSAGPPPASKVADAPVGAPARTPDRNPPRKSVSGPPFVPDDKLTAWYEKHYAAHPDDVYRIARPTADKHFQPKFKVGKNQLYDVMRAVQKGLKPGKR